MESEENIIPDTEPTATSSSDTLAATPDGSSKKKKAKKKDQGSDAAFFASFPCIVVAAVAIVLTVVGFLPMGWFADLCASLRAQLVLVLLICVLPPLFAPQVRLPMLIACGVFMFVNLAFVVPCMFPKPEPTADQKSLAVLSTRILQFSVEDPATPVEPIVEQITALHPDVICVTGIPDPVLLKLNEQMPVFYMHRKSFPRDDGYALSVYSTSPLKGTTLKKVGPEKLPLVSTTIHFDYGWYRIILMKVPEATDDKSLEKRNEQLKATAQVIKGLSGRKIVVGNFNTSPYAMAFGNFLKDADLKDTRIGVQPNWNLGPVDLGVTHIPVDHILATSNVAFKTRFVCPPMGLTHRPLMGDFYRADKDNIPYEEEAESIEGDEPAAAPRAEAAAEKPAAKPAEEKPGKKRRKRGK
jgi:endonuclease/exonuclease/phosphatase (EEP) superfamily protein YafD